MKHNICKLSPKRGPDEAAASEVAEVLAVPWYDDCDSSRQEVVSVLVTLVALEMEALQALTRVYRSSVSVPSIERSVCDVEVEAVPREHCDGIGRLLWTLEPRKVDFQNQTT